MTKEKFSAYVSVQESGMTNMFNISNVIELSLDVLNKEDCLDIMKKYSEYKEEYK